VKLPPELRALLVKNLAAALAAAWRRHKDEPPRDDRGVRDDEDHERSPLEAA
jgi:hypothetical protein